MSCEGEQNIWRRVDWVLLGAVAAWAVAVRLAFLAAAAGHPYYVTPVMDMDYHDAWARRIVAGDFWGSEPFFRAPLYPYFLALWYWLGGGSILFARAVQAFVGGVSAALCFLLGRELFDRRVGAVAALALGTAWTAVFYDVELLLVVLEVPLGLAFVYFAVRASKSLRLGWAAAAGAALGLGAVTRPNVLAVGVLMWVAFFVARAGRRLPWRRIVNSLVVLYAVGGAFVAAVAVRNYAVAREPVVVSWQGGVNLWIGNNPEADGMTAMVPGTYGDWWRSHYESIRMAEKAAGRPLNRSGVDRYYYGQVFEFFREEPGEFFKLLGRKTYFFTNAYEVANNFDLYYLKKQFWVLKYDPVSSYVILPFAFFGMIASARRWRRLAPLYIFVIFYSASVILFFVNARFRMPVVPYLCIFAAVAFFYFWDNLRRWRRREVALRVAGLAALFIFCDADPFGIGRQSKFESQGHYTLGTVYLEAGDLDAAQREYEAALEGGSCISAVDALNDLGIIAARRGDMAKAGYYFRTAVTVKPDYSRGWNNLGNIRADAGDAEGAREFYERAIAVDAEDARAYYFYGKLLLKEGDAAGAAEKFERAVHYEPSFPEAWLELGNIYGGKGDLARARVCFEKVVYYKPTAAYGRRALGEVLHRLGDYAGAERQHRLMLASREDARARYNLACALARQGRGDEAMTELKRALELAPGRYRKMAATDEDLASLRGRPDFEGLISP
ncbi:MAG: tetratricopeptide repeat protein [candidate division Zixibacteria bacterium]|nr:tetratricopeptide repeat protein [candidate division Zixibacteria bacterium]